MIAGYGFKIEADQYEIFADGFPYQETVDQLDAIAAVVIGGTLLTGGSGFIIGTVLGVLLMGLIQTYINFDGSLSSWWSKIVIGGLLFFFIALQKLLSKKLQKDIHLYDPLVRDKVIAPNELADIRFQLLQASAVFQSQIPICLWPLSKQLLDITTRVILF